MKKISKLLAAFAVLFALAACSAKEKVVTQWSLTDGINTMLVTFYNNGVCNMTFIDSDGNVASDESGKYSGNTTKDGNIEITGPDGSKETAKISGNTLDLGDGVVFTKVEK